MLSILLKLAQREKTLRLEVEYPEKGRTPNQKEGKLALLIGEKVSKKG